MAAIITNNFRFLQSENFKANFDVGSSSKIYLGIAKPSPWANELVPDAPNSSTTLDVVDYRELMAAKLISGTSATYCIRRVDWVQGTIYEQFSDTDESLFEKNFYVMTDEYNIYKCIYRPTPSTQSMNKPTGTGTSGFITTADGYKWKYMLTLSRTDIVNYLTSEWIPVRYVANLGESGDTNQWQVQQAAVKGTIDRVAVSTGGTGYGSVSIVITGDGSGATATATVSGGVITAINITNPGSNYTWATVTINGTNTTPASAVAIIAPGSGHGSNVVRELGGWYIMVNTIIAGDEGGKFPRYNDYRKVFLIQSPNSEDGSPTGIPAVGSLYNCTTRLTFTSVSGEYTLDSTVTGVSSGAQGVVVDYDSTTKKVSLVNVTKPFTVGETVTGTATGTNLTAINKPELVPNSGTIVYKDYRRLVSRDITQSENIVVVVGF